MYRRILIPLDGSKRAERVLPHVMHLARGGDTDVLLLHVVEPPVLPTTVVAPTVPSAGPTLMTLEDAMKQAQDDASQYLDAVRTRFEKIGFSCDVLLEQGGVVHRVAHAAQAHDVDLIAMTSHGRTGLGTAFFGSVALGVIHRVERPVLLIRAREASDEEERTPEGDRA